MRLALLSALSIALLSTTARAEEWQIDPAHSNVSFSIRHMMVSNVKGDFSKVSGTLIWDEKNPSKSSMTAEIDAASITTRDDKRDEHLRSADFFDVANFPKITFKSTRIERTAKGKFKVIGEATIHGITKPMTLEVTGPSQSITNPWGQTVMAASATGKLNRKDFGINWNKALDAGGFVVGEEVNFTIEVELVKQEAKAPKAEK